MIGSIIRVMILNNKLMQNFSDNAEAVKSSLLSPTGGVKSIFPMEENAFKNGYGENDYDNMSDETKCETNYSINKHAKQAPHRARHQ